MTNRYSVGSRRPRGYPVLKTGATGRQAAVNTYATLQGAQDVADALNKYAYQEAEPVSKAPKGAQ